MTEKTAGKNIGLSIHLGLCLLLALATLPALAGDEQSFGDGVKIETATPIRDILTDPDSWAGKTVRVEGQVVGVCAAKGCWMELASRDGDHLRVKVEDDVIVFPPEAEGRWAAAEGQVSVREMSREQFAGWLRHLAEEQGETFDDESVGEGPYQLVQIQAAGAEIGSTAGKTR